MTRVEISETDQQVAIIGMAGRFPGAPNIEALWHNLCAGVESVTFFSDEELVATGTPPTLLQDPHYVKAKGVLDDIDRFDAAFFRFSPREAAITDPQQRLFLECAWTALEHAGYGARTADHSISLHAGIGINTYLQSLYANPEIMATTEGQQIRIGNEKDHLATRAAYKLNLRGPCLTVQTACSTSLVAVHLACQSLLNGECDMALAGGVRVRVPEKSGYVYHPGGILSPDGHCRTFDARAQGTVAGDGVAIVVLKRLTQALSDGDCIHAVIKGSAINNDGALKVGYTAPSVERQAAVIVEALAVAGVEPETVTYIEAHGTGTALGDPVEMAALSRAFRAYTEATGFCAVGSVKTNIGHLDVAAGITGLIKTVLALKHGMLPPSLNFERPNPEINFADSPFYVNSALRAWERGPMPRRAGVSSFGFGGTNAHVVLEEAPEVDPSGPSRPRQLLLLSAKTDAVLETATANLLQHIETHPQLNLADVAYTLQVGREAFSYRRMIVCRDRDDALALLRTPEAPHVLSHVSASEACPVVFMFPGQGSQYVQMARELYDGEVVFRRWIDVCAKWLEPHLELDLRHILFPDADQTEMASRQLQHTYVTQPALFSIQYALARTWMAWDVCPEAMIGHSIGEYVAACFAGVIDLEDALALVAARGKLMQQLPSGAMLVVPLPEATVRARLGGELSLAAVNGPALCVVAGPTAKVERFAAQLRDEGTVCHRVRVSHAFHSAMMTPVLAPFTERVAQVDLRPPQIPYVSNLTGTWITAEEATDPGYWARHLRHTVRFASGIATLLTKPQRVFLEVGPGQTLSTLVRQQATAGQVVLTSLGSAQRPPADLETMLSSLGRLWLAGVEINGSGFYANERRYRLPLPTYPFERQRYWIEPPKPAAKAVVMPNSITSEQVSPGKTLQMADWLYRPLWQRANWPASPALTARHHYRWLIFTDADRLGAQLIRRLQQKGCDTVTVRMGETFARSHGQIYTLNPRSQDDYDALFSDLRARGWQPRRIVHLWHILPDGPTTTEPEWPEWMDHVQDVGFYSLLHLARALGKQEMAERIHIGVLSNDTQIVSAGETLRPEKVTILAPCKVIPQEYANLTCCHIDIALPTGAVSVDVSLLDRLLDELSADNADAVVAYRGQQRYVQTFAPLRSQDGATSMSRLRERGVYLITGGLGGIGLTLAGYLARQVRARLLLLGRSVLPTREAWPTWLATHHEKERTCRIIRQVQALEALGSEVLLLSADVSDADQMHAAMAQVDVAFGRINGVIHAAGQPDGAVIQRRTRSMSERVMAPKVQGVLVLDRLLQGHDLDFVVLCSSMSAILPPFGQVAYGAANAFLDAFACYKTARDGTFTVSVNWDAWQEVGMAVDASKPFADTPGQATPQARAVAHPLFDYAFTTGPDEEVYVSHFRGCEHWVLREHTFCEQSLLPGTAYLEMARAAFAPHAKNEPVEMRDVCFLRPLMVEAQNRVEVHTVLTRREDGYAFVIKSRSCTGADVWRDHARGRIGYIEAASSGRYDLRALEGRCQRSVGAATETEPSRRGRLMAFGPRWDTIQQCQYTHREGFACLQLPAAFADDTTSYGLHPALFDTATGFLTGKVNADGHYLPFSYQRIRIHACLPARVFSYCRLIDPIPHRQETLRFDLTLLDEQGNVLVEIESYTLRKIDPDAVLADAGHESALPRTPVHESQPVGVGMPTPGNLDTLTLFPVTRRKPRPGEVEIDVCAAGLNFKEVLQALGLLPSPAESPLWFGLECAGRIVAVGDGVDDIALGDEVMGFASPSFRSYVTTPASWVAPKPEGMSFEAAATIPVAYLTAYYALMVQGRLRQGERVLIHAAAGGVGLAAVRVAQWVGANIFATAGNPEKRDFLRTLGIEYVMDSRSLAFADDIMQYTNGAGVDVVLNALAGAFIPKSLEVLAPYGRFLELGLRDLSQNSQLGLRPFTKSLSFHAIMAGPQLPDFPAIWRDVVAAVAAGHFQPLPHRAFPMRDADLAFDHMAQAGHIGKIVLSCSTPSPLPALMAGDGTRTSVLAPDTSVTNRQQAGHGDALFPAEGAAVFGRVLHGTDSQVVVSTRDLKTRLKQAQMSRARRLHDGVETAARATAPHARPALGTPYVAPRNFTEQTLAGIWQELLGIERVGIHDDFFQLGGHSLFAIQVLARIRSFLQVELPPSSLFEAPSVATLAQMIDRSGSATTVQPIVSRATAARQHAAQLLANLDQLSDDEVEALLREQCKDDEAQA